MNNIVYLNGNYIPQNKATISIMDRGFLFGDGVYEVIPVFNGKLFELNAHLTRLNKSLTGIGITNPCTSDEWKKIFETLLEKNNKTTGNHSCYCQITRGAEASRHHTIPKHILPTIVAFIMPFQTHTMTELSHGYSAITINETAGSDYYIKSITLLPNILKRQKAHEMGAIDAILIRNNEVLECTSSNLFIVKNNQLLTPALSSSVLNGVTRQLVIMLAHKHHIDCIETHITPEMLMHADEVWITGSIKEICPITSIDGQMIGPGKAGPMWQRMIEWYEQYKNSQRS